MNIEESTEILKNMILMPDGWIIGKNYKGNLEFIGCSEGQEAIETLLNLIEKQSKEIEELKERYERANKRYLKSLQEKDDKCEKLLEYVETEKETDYISKDKIKATIEEVSDGTYDAKIVLQSLLKEE